MSVLTVIGAGIASLCAVTSAPAITRALGSLTIPETDAAHAAEMKKNPDMEHADEHSLTLGMYATGELLWRFTRKGRFVFACLVPGHLERGMQGTIMVQ